MKPRSFKDWDVANFVVSPIIANLITGLIIFICILLFKESIYNVFKPNPKLSDFPIYTIAEPYLNHENILLSDIYIINLLHHKITDKDLESFLINKKNEYGRIDQRIKMKVKDGYSLVDIVDDKVFNAGKGQLKISQPENINGEWCILIEEIEGRSILKVIVKTNHRSSFKISRIVKAALPFYLSYPGN